MLTRERSSRAVSGSRSPAALCLIFALLAAPRGRIDAQATIEAVACDWRGWAFVRLGPAETSQPDAHGRDGALLGAFSGGVAASYRRILMMVRATDTDPWSFSDSPTTGTRDFAVLAGARSRGSSLFVTAAAGIAEARQTDRGGGLANVNGHLSPAFDLSAHADYRVAGGSLTVSGVLGPATSRYIAISLGAELGWFGFR
jgi:hypothetical protein